MGAVPTGNALKGENLKALFEPRSIAVVGASRREGAVGHAVIKNLVKNKFTGKIFPINPKSEMIEGYYCLASLEDIHEEVDLAVIIVPGPQVPDVLRQCGRLQVHAAIIISAGFRETGPAGLALEQQIKKIAHDFNISLLGPNCLGVINTATSISMNASFARTMPKAGKIAFVSQSGALCAAILDYAKGRNIGFSKFVSLGNKTDLNELDVLEYLKDDSETSVILMYLEDLVSGRDFIEKVRKITGENSPVKPVLAIKSGRTAQGAQAASSHTGSLMGSDEVYDAIFAQAGVMRVDSVEEMFNYAQGFVKQPMPKGKRVGIVTNAGGPGIMATDACIRYGLQMAEFEPATQKSLKMFLPPTASCQNPVDVIGDAQHDRYRSAISGVLADPNVDSLIVILTPQAMTDIENIAEVIVEADKKSEKPIMACFMGVWDVAKGVKILDEHDIPHYIFPEDAARTLAAMNKYREWIERPRTDVKIFPVDKKRARQEIICPGGRTILQVDESMDILSTYGFPILPWATAGSEAEALQQAAKVGYPVALKIISPQVNHKYDVGGVVLHLANSHDVHKAYSQMMEKMAAMPSTQIHGVMVQAMAKKGREVILGMKRDPHFGPILMFGMGGTYVEVFKDVSFRLAPVREFGARRMVESTRAFPLLNGVRGEKKADFKVIIECLERLSQLACEHPEISEIDINPLMVYEEGLGAAVVDARFVLNPSLVPLQQELPEVGKDQEFQRRRQGKTV